MPTARNRSTMLNQSSGSAGMTFAYLCGLPLWARKNLFCSYLRLTVTPLQSCLCCSNSRLFCSNCACCCSPVHFRVSSLCFTIYGHSSTSDSHNLIWRKPTEKCRLPLSITCSISYPEKNYLFEKASKSRF